MIIDDECGCGEPIVQGLCGRCGEIPEECMCDCTFCGLPQNECVCPEIANQAEPQQ